MDAKLIAWARAVKGRRHRLAGAVPPLWIFTDPVRLPDPRPLLAALPKGLCGVVFRPGLVFDEAAGTGLARLCRQRRFVLVAAGGNLAPVELDWAGRHMGRGARGITRAQFGLNTASAHGWDELVRARRLGVQAVFLSPVFPTASHPGAASLGVLRWAALARRHRGPVLALGGVTAANVRRLPRFCAGVGVIGAAGGLAIARAAR